MNPRPTFSVLIPTYNRAVLVARAIESVLAQTYSNSEIIVIDDGSTDRTAEVVRHFEIEHGDRVAYSWQQNQGKSTALNNGFQRTRGEFIAFLDSDDRWLPEKLEWQLRAIERFGVGRPCFTDAKYVNNPALSMTAFEFAHRKYEDVQGVIPAPTELLLGNRSGIYIQTLVLHKILYQRIGNFDPQLCVGEDTDFLFRLALTAEFCYVNQPLVEIDRTMNRADGLIDLLVRDESLRLEKREYLYQKWLALTCDLGNRINEQLLARLAEIHSEWANWYLVRRQYGKARHAMSTSIATSFNPKVAAKLAFTVVAPALARRQFMRRESERAEHRVTA